MNWPLIGIGAYVLLQLGIGIYVSRKVASEEDYYLAGRSLGYWLATFTLFATWFGAETCIGAAGAIYDEGLSGGSADPFGYGACLLFMGLVFAAPLWRRKLTTLADLFRQRFSVGVERLAVLLMVPTSILWAAAQVRAFGQVLDATTGIGVGAGVTIAAAVAIIYTGLGGMKADVITDLIQGVVIVAGLLLLFGMFMVDLGGPIEMWSGVDRERLNLFGGESSFFDLVEAWAVPICGSVVAQELVARVIAAKSPQVARGASLLGGSFYLLIGLIPVSIGLIGLNLFPDLESGEQILPMVAQKFLPPVLYLVFAGALISAILSTVDSTLLASSALISHNLIVPLRPKAGEKEKLVWARIGVIGSGVAAYALAMKGGTVYELVEAASSFGSAGIFVVVVSALFMRWGGVASAYGALIAGAGVWLAGEFWIGFSHAYLWSLAAAAAAYAIGSLARR